MGRHKKESVQSYRRRKRAQRKERRKEKNETAESIKAIPLTDYHDDNDSREKQAADEANVKNAHKEKYRQYFNSADGIQRELLKDPLYAKWEKYKTLGRRCRHLEKIWNDKW